MGKQRGRTYQSLVVPAPKRGGAKPWACWHCGRTEIPANQPCTCGPRGTRGGKPRGGKATGKGAPGGKAAGKATGKGQTKGAGKGKGANGKSQDAADPKKPPAEGGAAILSQVKTLMGRPELAQCGVERGLEQLKEAVTASTTALATQEKEE